MTRVSVLNDCLNNIVLSHKLQLILIEQCRKGRETTSVDPPFKQSHRQIPSSHAKTRYLLLSNCIHPGLTGYFVLHSRNVLSFNGLEDQLKTILHACLYSWDTAFTFLKHLFSVVLDCILTRLGYIGEFEEIDDHRSGKIVIQLNGRLNKCGVISPRFNIRLPDLENWVNQLLPARSIGYVVLTTSAGIMDHEEARRKHVAGKILGFFY